MVEGELERLKGERHRERESCRVALHLPLLNLHKPSTMFKV